MLRERTMSAFRDAGYEEGRQIDVHRFEDALQGSGFEITPAARRFLQRFGNLVVSVPHPAHRRVTISMHFDAARAASSVYPEKIHPLEERVGAALCPVGEALGGVLLMDPEGGMYAALDDWISKLGASPEEALEELCSGGSGTLGR